MDTQSKSRKRLHSFSPEVYKYNHFKRRDLLCSFSAGKKNYSFTEFIKSEAEEYAGEGNGATYVVVNTFFNEQTEAWEILNVVGYYTLAVTAIPYEDRICECDDEGNFLVDSAGNHVYNSKMCGIPAIYLKMFAIDEKYQDMFYDSDGLDLPVAAWVLRSIIDSIDELSSSTIGVKAIFLHSVPEAEQFYRLNGFNDLTVNMKPFHDVDAEFAPMYYMLREVTMTYET